MDWEVEEKHSLKFLYLAHSVDKYILRCCKEPHSVLLIFSLQALVNAIRALPQSPFFLTLTKFSSLSLSSQSKRSSPHYLFDLQ